MSDLVQSEIIGNVGVLRVNNPPVNALSPGVPEAILAGVSAFAENDQITSIVLAGGGRTFIAGADIRELNEIAAGEKEFDASLQEFLDQLEATPKPLIAAIHGAALGGGLETAQACHWRVADRHATVGQPEVELGLIPGAAGTQRLPRLVGVVTAARMCATGRTMKAEEAVPIGLIDAVFDENLIEQAVHFAESVSTHSLKSRRTSQLPDRLGDPEDNTQSLEQLRDEIEALRPGETAPLLAIEAVGCAAALPFDAGCQQELRLFDECMKGSQASAMIRAFFGIRKAAMGLSSREAKSLEPWNEVVVLHGGSQSIETPASGLELLAGNLVDVELSTAIENAGADAEHSEDSVAILVPQIDSAQSAEAQYHSFINQIADARKVIANSQLLVLLPTGSDASEYLTLAENEPLLWIGFSPCGGRAAEVYAGPGNPDAALDQLVAFLRKQRITGFRRTRLGPQAVSILQEAMQLASAKLIEQGVPQAKITEALRRVGFRCNLQPDPSGNGDSNGWSSSKIVTNCVDAMIEAANRLRESRVFSDDLQLDMLAIKSGLYPAHRGGPCWERNAKTSATNK